MERVVAVLGGRPTAIARDSGLINCADQRGCSLGEGDS